MIDWVTEWALIIFYWLIVGLFVNKNTEKYVSNVSILSIAFIGFFILIIVFGNFEITQEESWWEF